MLDLDALTRIIRSECAVTAGCTDPGCVALAVARARRELGAEPEQIDVRVSPNLYKNAVSVGIPGTEEHGLALAAALGGYLDRWEDGLAVLSGVTEPLLARARALAASGAVRVQTVPAPDPLYVRAEVRAGGDAAAAEIQGDYTAVVRVTHGERVVFEQAPPVHRPSDNPLLRCSLREIYDLILRSDPAAFGFLTDYARINWAAAEADLANPRMTLGPALKRTLGGSPAECAQLYTAAAGEARMAGLNVKIIAIAGSGNHGITNFVGVTAAARALGSSPEAQARALALSSAVTIYIKGYLQRMTAFCGCSVAAATGVAAAVVYLMGGSWEQSVHAMQSVIGTLGGMFCDGAKLSCAYKLSTAARMAVQFAELSLQACYLPERVGILGGTIEQTFANIGRLNDPGMLETEKEIVSAIRRSQGEA